MLAIIQARHPRPLWSLAVGATAACAGLLVAGCQSSPGSSSPGAAPRLAASAFLSAYAQPDGQVVRTDQGSDTVSEGQAYGMLLAEAAGDDAEFRQIWTWTRDHLQLRDALFAYHASPSGQVLNAQPAADADLLIAWALLRYHGTSQAAVNAAGHRVADAILAREVTTGPDGTAVLTAGPWATGRPASLDPSYWSLPALRGLSALTGSPEWNSLAAGAVTITRVLTQDGRTLPPDWAELSADGTVRPEPAPSGTQPQAQYGPDAQRTVAWFAASCDPAARALAARWWPLLRSGHRDQDLSLAPGGTVLNAAPAVLPLVASAAAAKAAGDNGPAQQLLQRAASQQHAHPTYYGGAWNGFGHALLTSDAFGTC